MIENKRFLDANNKLVHLINRESEHHYGESFSLPFQDCIECGFLDVYEILMHGIIWESAIDNGYEFLHINYDKNCFDFIK